MSKHAQRIARLQERVGQSELDAFLVTSQESIYYLTGASYKPLERPFIIVVWPRGRKPALLVPELEREHMRKAEGFDEVQSYREYPAAPGQGWHDRLLAMLAGSRVVGVEPAASAEITGRLAGLDARPLPLVENLRLVKSDVEIAAIQSAAEYASLGMKLMCAGLYRGATPLELFSISRKVQTKVIAAGGYDPLASEFLTACWPAPWSAMPHGIPALNARAGEGPVVLMSFLRVNGYAAECERTVFLEEPDEEMKKAFRSMNEARELAFGMLRPGADCAGIDGAVQEFLAGKGYGKFLLHRTGHGIGLGNHEGPWLSVGSQHRLEPGMAVSVEPGIYIPGVGGFRHSDTVLVTDTGFECLTQFPTELEKLLLRGAKPLKRAKGAIIKKLLRQ